MLGPKLMFLSCVCRSSKCSLHATFLIGCQHNHHATTIIFRLQIINMFIAYYNNCSFCWLLMCSLCTTIIIVIIGYWCTHYNLLQLLFWMSSQKTWIWLGIMSFQRIATSFSIIPLILVSHLYFFFVLARIFLFCTHIFVFKNSFAWVFSWSFVE
jgi:hypothetical protein